MSELTNFITFIRLNISDQQLGQAVCDFMTKHIDQKFWSVPASSSGKYHPAYALGEGGLARHTIAALVIAKDLLEISKLQDTRERDIVFASLAIHDSCKQGFKYNGHTVWEHPLIAADEWRAFAENYIVGGVCPLATDMIDSICGSVSSHMGKWTTSNYSQVVLPAPKTLIQKFVHICDYLASRKSISVDVENVI